MSVSILAVRRSSGNYQIPPKAKLFLTAPLPTTPLPLVGVGWGVAENMGAVLFWGITEGLP